MDHLLSVRFWGTVLALVTAIAAAVFISTRADIVDRIAGAGVPPDRRIETSGVVTNFRSDAGWRIRDGRTVGEAEVTLDEERRFVIGEGTPADLRCAPTGAGGSCVLFADLLGGAVVWLALVPIGVDGEVELPGAVAVLDAGREARLANGWIVPLVDRVERDCPTVETSSFRDFVNRIGADGVAVYDLGVGEVTTVRCVGD
jgi:hypothetical protein